MTLLASSGVDAIITDEPALARRVLRERAAMDPGSRLVVRFAVPLGLEPPASGESGGGRAGGGPRRGAAGSSVAPLYFGSLPSTPWTYQSMLRSLSSPRRSPAGTTSLPD